MQLPFSLFVDDKVIATEGTKVEIVKENREVPIGTTQRDYVFPEFEVRLASGETRLWWPNKSTLIELQRDLGKDTSKWIGKTVLMSWYKTMIANKEKLVFKAKAVPK